MRSKRSYGEEPTVVPEGKNNIHLQMLFNMHFALYHNAKTGEEKKHYLRNVEVISKEMMTRSMDERFSIYADIKDKIEKAASDGEYEDAELLKEMGKYYYENVLM